MIPRNLGATSKKPLMLRFCDLIAPSVIVDQRQAEGTATGHKRLTTFRARPRLPRPEPRACRGGAAERLGIRLRDEILEEVMTPALESPGQRIGIMFEPEDALVHEKLIARSAGRLECLDFDRPRRIDEGHLAKDHTVHAET